MEDKEIAVINTIEKKALTIVEEAQLVVITDAETYTQAGYMWKALGDTMKEIDDTFQPIIETAHKTWKQALTQKAKYYDPLDKAKRKIKSLMAAYDDEQERLRREEQRRLEEIARKEEEERKLKEALEAEEAGNNEEAAAIIDEPVIVAPIVIPKATPKLNGGPVYQTRWDFEIVDENLIPRQYLIIDKVKIGGVVRALKGQTNIPGIKVFPRKV